MEPVHTLRTPRAAGVAGIVFALLLAMALVLLRTTADTMESHRAGLDNGRIALALSLVPFAGIAFLWLMGVVRDRIGAREDRFLATVSLGSGLLFVAMLFVASGVAAGGLAAASHAEAGHEVWLLSRRISGVLMNTYAMRMAAVFMFSTSTIALRTGFIPRWIGLFGYLIALVLLVGIHLTLWVELLFPLWVLVLSIDILLENFRGGSKPEVERELVGAVYRKSA